MEMDMSESKDGGSDSAAAAASASVPKPEEESWTTGTDVTSSAITESTTAAAATSTTAATKTISLTLAKKKKTKKKPTSSSSSATHDGAESVRQAFDQETVRQDEDGSGNGSGGDDKNKAPLVIPVAANRLRFQTPAAPATTTAPLEATAAVKDLPTNSEDNEALEALQAQSTTSRRGQETQDERGKRTIVIMNLDGNESFQQRETQQFKSDLQAYPEPVPLDSEQYQRVPIADFGAALLRGMGWTGESDNNGNKRSGKNNNTDDTVMPRPHRLGLGAIPVAATSTPGGDASIMDTHSNSKRRRALRPDQLQQKQRLQQQQEEYQRQRQEQVAQDKQRTMQNGSVVYMRIPSTSSQGSAVVAKVKQEESQEEHQQQSRRYRACILQLVGVPGLNMVRVQYENESVESIVKRGDMDRLVTREELEQEPFVHRAAASATRESSSASNKKNDGRDKSQRSGGGGIRDADSDDRKRVKQDPDDDYDSRRPEKRRGRGSDDDDDDSYRNKSSSSHKRSRHNGKDDDNSDDYSNDNDSSRRSKDVRKKKDSDRDRDRRRRDEDRGESSKSRRREQTKDKSSSSSSSSSSVYWATPHIRVRIISEKLGRRYFKEKAVVLDVTHKGITLQLSSSSSSSHSSSLVLDRVPERYLETALPKAGGCVLVLRGNHRGVKGRLLERDSKRAVGIIQTSQDLEVLTLPLDDMAEWMGPIDDE